MAPQYPTADNTLAGTSIIVSDVAIACMLSFLAVWSYRTGFSNVWRLYFVPWLVRPRHLPFLESSSLPYRGVRQWAHNWIVMFTYLQHSDPTVPYYREVRSASLHIVLELSRARVLIPLPRVVEVVDVCPGRARDCRPPRLRLGRAILLAWGSSAARFPVYEELTTAIVDRARPRRAPLLCHRPFL